MTNPTSTIKSSIIFSHQVGGRAVGYYMGTTVLAVITGIILVTTIHPGVVGQEKVLGKVLVLVSVVLIKYINITTGLESFFTTILGLDVSV